MQFFSFHTISLFHYIKKYFYYGVIFSIFGIFGNYIFAQEACVSEGVKTNNADMNYYYLGDYTVQGTSMMDLLLMEKISGLNNKGDKIISSQKRGLITHFCDVILRTRDDKNMKRGCFDNGDFRYDPRQSLFVYALCVNMDDKGGDKQIAGIRFPKRNFREKVFQNVQYIGGGKPFNLVQYIDEEVDKDLNSIWGLPTQADLDAGITHDNCNPATSMQGCRFTRFLPHIFNTVMNAYANMKLASIYGYKYILSGQDVDAQAGLRREAIKDFSHAYFSSPTEANTKSKNNECNVEGGFYLNDEAAEKDAEHCRHKKVYTLLDETIKSLQELLKKVAYVKAEDVLASSCKNPKRDMMSCAFSSTGDRFTNGDWVTFQNLYMNELMRYTLFSTYYMDQIRNSTAMEKLKVGDRYSEGVLENQKEAEQLEREIIFAKEAMYQTMRRLQNLYTTFPIHIGLMAYLEDLEAYRKVLARIYTPLQQLSSLRPDAQSCQK